MAAYKKLSQMHPDPNAQGATQKISAIRHFIALDVFYKLHNRDCNTRMKDDKDEYSRLVGMVCDVCQNLYTTNFYIPLKDHTGDFCVGSNFYSAGQVSASLVNPQKVFDYPKRGKAPLMKVQNGVLMRTTSLYNNLKHYVGTVKFDVALVVWLIRNISIDQNNGNTLYDNIHKALSNVFTNELLNVLFYDSIAFKEELNRYDLTFEEHPCNIKETDIDDLFEKSSSDDKEISLFHQVIHYGAPGTGKSYKIKKQLENVAKANIFRTTFHPDSDYSTFVGAYKPTMKKKYRYDGKVKAKYYEDDDLAGAKRDEVIIDKVIEYDFVPQTFIKAYVRAYQTEENVYLIIEEINRGNCAQIFGDLFQLLDRDENGVSDYTIKADADLKIYLEDVLGADSEGIKDGELCLPSNLYIFATMNTSDQSLFPIDSAFKRRWDWEYEPIKYKNTDWVIEIDKNEYSWTSFQKNVNDKIFDANSSEDKMLGDYFVKPNNGVISEKLLLNKVLFYLWNDVCKDGDGDIFKTEDNKDVKFSDLYGEKGTETLLSMMRYLKVEQNDTDGDNPDLGNPDTKYSVNDGEPFQKTYLATEVFKEYVKRNSNLSASDVLAEWNKKITAWKNAKIIIPKHLIESKEGYSQYIETSKNEAAKKKNEGRFEPCDFKGETFYLWKGWGDGKNDNITPFKNAINNSDWGITITRI